MGNFIQSDCFCRCATVTVESSLSIDGNLVIEILAQSVNKDLFPFLNKKNSKFNKHGVGGIYSGRYST